MTLEVRTSNMAAQGFYRKYRFQEVRPGGATITIRARTLLMTVDFAEHLTTAPGWRRVAADFAV